MRDMEKEEPNNTSNNIKEDQHNQSHVGLIRKPSTLASNSISGDRLKRDEWSEGAVSSLLDAYESKWVLRNRAKLKGQDWEDVASHVSSRANSTKSSKTQTQCKNKIESMKKRYRSESCSTDPSSWPLFQRLDQLLRCRTSISTHPPTTTNTTRPHPPLVILDPPPPPLPPSAPLPLPPSPLAPLPVTATMPLDSHESNEVDRMPTGKEEQVGVNFFDNGSDKMSMDQMGSSGSTPVSETIKEKLKMKKIKVEKEKNKNNKKRRRGNEEWEIADSIRWLGEVVMKSEQAKMETMKEIEKMRIEAEAKKVEMELKRTEIIANTQLQIAKILASNGKDIDSSLRVGTSTN